jgi:hypothetical protein
MSLPEADASPSIYFAGPEFAPTGDTVVAPKGAVVKAYSGGGRPEGGVESIVSGDSSGLTGG